MFYQGIFLYLYLINDNRPFGVLVVFLFLFHILPVKKCYILLSSMIFLFLKFMEILDSIRKSNLIYTNVKLQDFLITWPFFIFSFVCLSILNPIIEIRFMFLIKAIEMSIHQMLKKNWSNESVKSLLSNKHDRVDNLLVKMITSDLQLDSS